VNAGLAGVIAHCRGGFGVWCASRYVGYRKDFFEARCLRLSAEARDGYIVRKEAANASA
jgi:hypothetical protein